MRADAVGAVSTLRAVTAVCSFAVVLIGQSLAAFVQPVFTNTPAKLAGE